MTKLMQQLTTTVEFIKKRTRLEPTVGAVLGSGLGNFVESIDIDAEYSFSELPHFVPPTVIGHGGKLVIGHSGKQAVAVLQGRVHFYEGHSMEQVMYPVRTLAKLGVKNLFLTNAAGGLSKTMRPGDFMLITDHINLIGVNPLRGPNEADLGTRFPDMSQAYDSFLTDHCAKILKRQKVRFTKGVYCGVSGPTYETAAEVRLFGKMGAKAVGMSTVPETVAAVHAGLKVAGISCITNLGTGLSKTPLSHKEVTEVSLRVEKQFSKFFSEILQTVPSDPGQKLTKKRK